MISLLALGERPQLPGRETMPARDMAAWRALLGGAEPAPGHESAPQPAMPHTASAADARPAASPAELALPGQDGGTDTPPTVAPRPAAAPAMSADAAPSAGPGAAHPTVVTAPATKPAAPALKAGQLAQRSTYAMAQRAHRRDEAPDGGIAPLQPLPLTALAASPQAHAAPPLPPAEMLMAAVERMLIAEPDRDGQQRVHLTLSADWFGETALTLTREAGGWHLDIATASPRVAASLRQASTELAGRFAARGLGRLNSEIRTTALWDILEEPSR
ncbi:hypothetical protein ABWL39_10325 [Chitinivorax sp. PXF-14]|uniref:hypothetical protein n=1 Tax=Chitinivorax sp. PXF-14 TaxID=3230488 RepID=UPI0034660FE6